MSNALVQYLIAIALLQSSPDELIPDQYQIYSKLIQSVAIQREILDEREQNYVLTRPDDFQADIRLLQNRVISLKDAPYIVESTRLPPRPFISDNLTINRQFRAAIKDLSLIDLIHSDELKVMMDETDQIYNTWDTIRDAKCEYYYITLRRNALLKLKQKIGEVNYYNCNFPPFLPIHRFRWLDGN